MASITETELGQMSTPASAATPGSSPPSSPILDTAQEGPIPPLDHGRGANLVLLGCAFAQAPAWGYSMGYPILQDYYTTHNASGASAAAIAAIGTAQTGVLYLSSPLVFMLLTRYSRLRAWCGLLGLVVSTASLLASAFATDSVGAMLATQGVLYALGCGLVFSPTTLYLDEWFLERKGYAYGVMWAAKSAVGILMPFAMAGMLDRFGLRITLIAWAVASAALTLPHLFLLRPRVPLQNRHSTANTESNNTTPLSFSFMRYPVFWMLQAGNVIQALGYLLPTTYLASYVSSFSLSPLPITAPLLLAAYSLASVPGSLVVGFLADHIENKPGRHTNENAAESATTTSTSILTIFITSMGSALSIFFLWGFSASHLSVLAIFAVLYGFFAGGYSSTWAGVLRAVQRADHRTDTGLVFGMLMGGRGVGFLLSGPISGWLLDAGTKSAGSNGVTYPSTTGTSFTSKFGPIVVWAGVTALLGAWGWVWTLRLGGKLTRLWDITQSCMTHKSNQS